MDNQCNIPEEIEKQSMRIIEEELAKRKVVLPPAKAAVLKRTIFVTADFDYIDNLFFSDYVMEKARKLLRTGANIVTDSTMVQAGIHKKAASMLGVKIHCFQEHPGIAVDAKNRNVTKSTIGMEYGSRLAGETIFIVGRAPTALWSLYYMALKNKVHPALIIGTPAGLVSAQEAKERIISARIPCIIAKGCKGGCNVAAAVCNELLRDALQAKNYDSARKIEIEDDSL